MDESDFRARIEEKLQALIGLSLWDCGRAVDLQWFALGGPIQIPDPWPAHLEARKRGEASSPPPRSASLREAMRPGIATRTVGEYALHVQCPWRFTGPDGILTGSGDLYSPAGSEPRTILEGFDWKRPGVTRLDERVAALFSERGGELVVREVRADAVGGLVADLGADHTLEVFPHGTASREFWRLFRPGIDEEHFVVTSHGIAS